MTGTLTDDLIETLHIVASAAAGFRDPWWIFGGAAMALAGLEGWRVPDVDIMASPRDARALIDVLGGRVVQDPGEGLFRSEVFGRILTTPVPLEVMARTDIRAAGDWKPVAFHSRMPVDIGGAVLFIPALAEQIATCRLFGRPKDLERAIRLEALIH